MAEGTDQEGAKEDEGDKVKVGEVAAALVSRHAGVGITRTVTQTRQHDLVPGFSRSAPKEANKHIRVYKR